LLKYSEEVYDRYHNGEMVNEDSNKIEKGPEFKTKGGRTVYGGGGIMPDIFVPFDTANTGNQVSMLYQKRTIYGFIYRYFVDNMSYLKSFKSAADFEKGFTVDDKVWKSFTTFAANDSISVNLLSPKDKQILSQRIKSYLAQQIWRRQGYYEVNNVKDEVVQKALESISKK
jgi:carboxyl-terminal processing protease